MEFGYHPPGLSPNPYSNASPIETSPGRLGHDGSPAFGRPGSGSGSGAGTPASGGFTATLPPLHEQPSNETVPTASGSRALHDVGYEQFVGGEHAVGLAPGDEPDLYASASSSRRQTRQLAHGQHSANSSGMNGNTRLISGSAGGDMEFRDPFSRTPSAGTPNGTDLGPPPAGYGGVFGFQPPPLEKSATVASTSQHSFFNPQTVHPSVNTRNTRPMTAPSGSGYLAGHPYSSVPSAFYVPPTQQHLHRQQQQHEQQQPPMSTSLNVMPTAAAFEPAPPVSSQGLFAFQPDGPAPLSDYNSSIRERGLSVPDALAGSMLGDRPVTADPDMLSASNPFMYQPPLLPASMSSARPYTAVTPGYYTALMDSFTGGVIPAPLQAIPPGSANGFVPLVEPQIERRRSSTSSGKYNFVPQPPQHTKRPRRRYDEIERMYNCDYPGCTKSYGTLNHLNSHKTMQKHGPKATPAQFKEMRKAWRERKKAEAAEAARKKAKEPFQATPVPYPPSSSLPAASSAPYPSASAVRPRPSTSAGEYTMGLPAHFVAPSLYSAHAPPSQLQASAGLAQPSLLLPPQAISDPRTQPGLYFDMQFSATGNGYADTSSRPVTAPAFQYAPPPPFGNLAPDPSQQQQQQHALSQSLSSSSGLSGARALASDPAHDHRRFSLPGGYALPPANNNGGFQLQQNSESMPPPVRATGHAPPRQTATPEMKMPQPVHAPSSYATLIGGGGSSSEATSSGENASNRSPRVNEVAAR